MLRKEMKNNGVIVVKPVSYALAKEICINNHYSKKWNTSFGKYNFGIFKESDLDNCLGIASFGNMMNTKSYKSILDNIEPNQIIELNRLWVDDCLGKNTETVFLSLCFKWLKQNTSVKVVQSFADGRLGCGTIYKASNFHYYGLHKTLFFKNIYTDEVVHKKLLEDTANLVTMIGENLGYIRGYFKPFIVKTYRYLYFLDKKSKDLCKLKELPYPQYEKGTYDIEFKQSMWVIARCFVACDRLNLEIANEFKSYLYTNYTQSDIEKALEKANQNLYLNEYLATKDEKYINKKLNTFISKYKKED